MISEDVERTPEANAAHAVAQLQMNLGKSTTLRQVTTAMWLTPLRKVRTVEWVADLHRDGRVYCSSGACPSPMTAVGYLQLVYRRKTRHYWSQRFAQATPQQLSDLIGVALDTSTAQPAPPDDEPHMNLAHLDEAFEAAQDDQDPERFDGLG